MKSSRKRYTAKGQAMFLVILALPVIVGVLTIVMEVGKPLLQPDKHAGRDRQRRIGGC